ncbi:MAG TPA: hypothetical protein PKA37_03995 [Planctomycetota bacterium]|nr:hypothetical protein [Planctomycetota bacterium]
MPLPSRIKNAVLPLLLVSLALFALSYGRSLGKATPTLPEADSGGAAYELALSSL